MNSDNTRIVTVAKIELISPRPISLSTPAAAPIRLGSFAASSSSLPVMSYSSWSWRSRSFSLTNLVTSWAYSGRFWTRLLACSTIGGTSRAISANGARISAT